MLGFRTYLSTLSEAGRFLPACETERKYFVDPLDPDCRLYEEWAMPTQNGVAPIRLLTLRSVVGAWWMRLAAPFRRKGAALDKLARANAAQKPALTLSKTIRPPNYRDRLRKVSAIDRLHLANSCVDYKEGLNGTPSHRTRRAADAQAPGAAA